MSAPSEDDWNRMIKLVETFYNRADAEPFRAPVEWKAYGLMDYPQIIKHPMDLGTIKSQLKKKNYKTLYQVNEDVRLVWSNCMTYNADGSDFYNLAKSLQEKWDAKYQTLLKECKVAAPAPTTSTAAAPASASNNNQSKLTIQERRNFAKSLYQITKEDLGRVLVELEQKCPESLKRNRSEDEVEINVDKLTPKVVAELTPFLQTAKVSRKKGPPPNKKLKPLK